MPYGKFQADNKDSTELVMLQPTRVTQRSKFRGKFISPDRKGTTLEAVGGWKDTGGDISKIERTNATYYTSNLYPEPLTPEYILGDKPGNFSPKKGQIPYPSNKWTPFEVWNYSVNNHHHKVNDIYPMALLGSDIWAGLTIEHEPKRDSACYSRRSYHDNVPAQTLGCALAGAQVGTTQGLINCVNLGKEVGIFQSMAMPPNRWLPFARAGLGFRFRLIGSSAMRWSFAAATYGLVDGSMSTIRGKDDIYNSFMGGISAGAVTSIWLRMPFWSLTIGIVLGGIMGYCRFMIAPDGAPKLALDLERPRWGVFGGFPMWFFGAEPHHQNFFNAAWTKKYWGGGFVAFF